MTPFSCGCTQDGATRCRAHWFFDCHMKGQAHAGEGECPPCRLARIRSVSLSSDATPTRRRA